MYTKTLATVLALVCPLSAMAFAGGDGSVGNPYQIATCQQLDSIRNVSNYQHQNYVLINDIDCTAFGSFDTIGPYEFDATFDGSGYAIDGLDISGTTYVGLFIWLNFNAVVHDLSITNATVTGTGNVSVGILTAYNRGEVTNVYTSGTVTSSNESEAGGMVGICSGVTMTNVTSDATVTVAGSGNSVAAGGLIGNAGTCDILYGSATGQVTQMSGTPSFTRLGGLLGRMSTGSCTECSATGNVSGGGGSVLLGGLVGNASSSTIVDSYATGFATGPNSGGDVGGLIGTATDTTITRAYASGRATGPSNAGALIGSVTGGTTFADVFSSPSGIASTGFGITEFFPAGSTGVFHQYFPSGVDCTSTPDPGCVVSTASQSTFYTSLTAPMDQWDFVNVWEEVPGDYPTLRNSGFDDGASGGGGPTCIVGTPFDWDGDLIDDGCRGTNVIIADNVTVPAGTQMGDDVTVMSGAAMGTGNVLYNGVTMAPGVLLGTDNTLQTNVVVGRRATLADGVTVLAETSIGRNVSIGDDSTVGGTLGYASQVGSNVDLPDMVLGNLAVIGSPTTPAGEIDCPGPLVLARSTSVAADPSSSFTCSGLVVVGPDSIIASADVEANIRLRKNSQLLSHVTLGDNVRIGRSAVLNGGVELATGTTVGTSVVLCDTSAPFSGAIPRGYFDVTCN